MLIYGLYLQLPCSIFLKWRPNFLLCVSDNWYLFYNCDSVPITLAYKLATVTVIISQKRCRVVMTLLQPSYCKKWHGLSGSTVSDDIERPPIASHIRCSCPFNLQQFRRFQQNYHMVSFPLYSCAACKYCSWRIAQSVYDRPIRLYFSCCASFVVSANVHESVFLCCVVCVLVCVWARSLAVFYFKDIIRILAVYCNMLSLSVCGIRAIVTWIYCWCWSLFFDVMSEIGTHPKCTWIILR